LGHYSFPILSTSLEARQKTRGEEPSEFPELVGNIVGVHGLEPEGLQPKDLQYTIRLTRL